MNEIKASALFKSTFPYLHSILVSIREQLCSPAPFIILSHSSSRPSYVTQTPQERKERRFISESSFLHFCLCTQFLHPRCCLAPSRIMISSSWRRLTIPSQVHPHSSLSILPCRETHTYQKTPSIKPSFNQNAQ